jgi:hypothetical protein
MRNTTRLLAALLASTTTFTCIARAQDAPTGEPLLPGRPDKDPIVATEAADLGPVFESIGAGLSIRPPVGGRLIRRPGDAEFVRWVYKKDNSIFSVSTRSLKRATSLTTADLPGAPDPGMLELAVADLKRISPGARVVRQDTTNVADHPVGMIAARYSVGTQSFLKQQAIVQASELSFYTISYVTPGMVPGTPDDAPPDPREQAAVDTFAAALDSVKLLDRTKIREDQDDRLYRTRSFFVNLSERKIDGVLVPESWARVMKNGKDVGYVYTVEEKADEKSMLGGKPSIRIGIRSRQFDDQKRQIDAEAWLQMTTDRKHEKWSRVSTVTEPLPKDPPVDPKAGKPLPPQRTNAYEIGVSDLSTKPVANAAAPGEAIGGNAGMRMVDEYPLTVKYTGSTGAPEPVERMLPPWYAPQAFVQLLPRLLAATGESKSYLFATYVTERREVMMRYVDVLPERPTSLAGKTVRAVRVQDKLGVDGFVTTHFISPDGAYLGSETRYHRRQRERRDGHRPSDHCRRAEKVMGRCKPHPAGGNVVGRGVGAGRPINIVDSIRLLGRGRVRVISSSERRSSLEKFILT